MDDNVTGSRVTCKQKQELLTLVKQVSNEKASLQKEELDAILAGSSTTDIELRMENAREMRKLVMERLRHHIADHGC